MKNSEAGLLCGLAGLFAVERPIRLSDSDLQKAIYPKSKKIKQRRAKNKTAAKSRRKNNRR
jgi:hypothetical protein